MSQDGNPAPWMDARARIVLLCLLGYVAIARGLGNVYPFSTFSMYSGARASSASRVVARDDRGALHEVTDYVAWSCGEAVDVRPERCAEQQAFYTIPYVDRAAEEYLLANGGDDPRAVPVDVVRHIWRFRTEPNAEDCVLQRCRAVPR
jgi:hypothetical protein